VHEKDRASPLLGKRDALINRHRKRKEKKGRSLNVSEEDRRPVFLRAPSEPSGPERTSRKHSLPLTAEVENAQRPSEATSPDAGVKGSTVEKGRKKGASTRRDSGKNHCGLGGSSRRERLSQRRKRLRKCRYLNSHHALVSREGGLRKIPLTAREMGPISQTH